MTVNDVLRRAAHTFWQAFLAALGVAWAASGLDVSQVVDIASAKKFALAAGIAILSALLSAAKSTLAGVMHNSLRGVTDTGPGSIDEPVDLPRHAGPAGHQPEHAAP